MRPATKRGFRMSKSRGSTVEASEACSRVWRKRNKSILARTVAEQHSCRVTSVARSGKRAWALALAQEMLPEYVAVKVPL